MIDCSYCLNPLICDSCLLEYVPPSEEHYQALSQPDIRLACPRCEVVLVCHWCKTPYDGLCGADDSVHPSDGT